MEIENDPIETDKSSNEESLGETIKAAFDKARDDKSEEVSQEKQPIAEHAEVAAEPATTDATLEVKAIRPPDSWSPAAKSKFSELPPEIQQEVTRREEEVHKGFTKFDEERIEGKHFKEVVAPYLPMIRAEGATPKEAVANLLQTAYTLRTADAQTKTVLFHRLAQQYGVNLQPQGNQQASQSDPVVHQLQNQVQQLTQFIENQKLTSKQQEDAQINSTIEGFASNPANLYFHDVKPLMATLLDSGKADTLEKAYEMACRADPVIYPLVLQAQQKQEAEKKREKANKAQNAASSVSGSPVGSFGSSSAPADSLRDELRNSLRAATGRV